MRALRTALYLIKWLPAALRHPAVARLGFSEGNSCDGVTYDNDPSSPRSTAYDVGRTVRRMDA